MGAATDPIGQTIRINNLPFRVVGLLTSKGTAAAMGNDQDDTIVVPVTTAMYRLLGREYVNLVDIEADSPQDTGPVADAVQAFMMKLKHIPNIWQRLWPRW